MDLAKPQSQDLCILWLALRERRLRQSIARALKCGLHQGVPGGFNLWSQSCREGPTNQKSVQF